MRVGVLGQGYVGLTAAVGLASAGHLVAGVECDPDRLRLLRDLRAPIFEPGLEHSMAEMASAGRLSFHGSLSELDDEHLDAIVVAVGSPPLPSGEADTTQVEAALAEAAASPMNPGLIMLKSSVPPGTSRRLLDSDRFPRMRERFVCSPEFLNQGTALSDWAAPDRVVIGAWSKQAVSYARSLFRGVNGRFVVADPTTAETIKYVSNSFLATRVSFANEMARFCEFADVDVGKVLHGAGLDPRIGELFWRPGIGYGDSCLPKDVDALIRQAAGYGQLMPLMESVQAVNRAQQLRPLSIVREERMPFPARRLAAAVLGVAYEPHSDDIRAAPSLALIPQLKLVASRITVWDPMVGADTITRLFPFADIATSVEAAVRKADVVLVMTEYPEVVGIAATQWAAMLRTAAEPVVLVDTKNCLTPDRFDPVAVRYRAIGRPYRPHSEPLPRTSVGAKELPRDRNVDHDTIREAATVAGADG